MLGPETGMAVTVDDRYKIHQVWVRDAPIMFATIFDDKNLEHNPNAQSGAVPGPPFHTCI